jgi:hypothetical protein
MVSLGQDRSAGRTGCLRALLGTLEPESLASDADAETHRILPQLQCCPCSWPRSREKGRAGVLGAARRRRGWNRLRTIAASVATLITPQPRSPFEAETDEAVPACHAKRLLVSKPPDTNVIILFDDVTTKGGLVMQAVRDRGATVKKIISLVDRLEGTTENRRKEGHRARCALYDARATRVSEGCLRGVEAAAPNFTEAAAALDSRTLTTVIWPSRC